MSALHPHYLKRLKENWKRDIRNKTMEDLQVQLECSSTFRPEYIEIVKKEIEKRLELDKIC